MIGIVVSIIGLIVIIVIGAMIGEAENGDPFAGATAGGIVSAVVIAIIWMGVWVCSSDSSNNSAKPEQTTPKKQEVVIDTVEKTVDEKWDSLKLPDFPEW